MTRRRSLEDRVTFWFAGTLVVLYGLVAVGLWGTTRQNGRRFAMLALETEVEAVAGYVAASGRFDAPELVQGEREPFPIWIRVTDEDRVLAETPGSPDPPLSPPEGTEEFVYWHPPGARDPMLVVRHAVGGGATPPAKKLTVQAIGDITSVRELERRLALGLLLLVTVMIPFATWIGRQISRRALAPMAGLVSEIRALPSERADQRLTTPDRAVAEVALLAESFNDVLARLDVSLETMRRFTEDASHEIRNPLAVLRTGLEISLRHDRTGEEYRALLNENLEEIRRLQSILDGLLLLARSEPGRRDALLRERVDVGRLAHETAARFSIIAAERQAPIEVDAAADAEIQGDPRLVRLIFFNLLDNALKHGPEGMPVALVVRPIPPDATRVRIEVSNVGRPIPEMVRDRLFERYDRPTSGERSQAGGLGLSVVRWAAQMHGGSVRYAPGAAGNRFEVTLQSVEEAPLAAHPQPGND